MYVRIPIRIDFREPVRLSEIALHKPALLVRGVYILTEGKPKAKVFDTTSVAVVCIGKAIRETIFSRCQKHLWSVQDARLSNGRPRSGPGHSFKWYREQISKDASLLWLTPGVMREERPYEISCAEEYLLHQYRQKHGRYPWCNSAGQQRHA